jgi:hypothetical protein
MTQITWRTNFSASALHTARAIVRKEVPLSGENATALSNAADQLEGCLAESTGGSSVKGWDLLVGLSSGIDSNQALAETWFRRAGIKELGTTQATNRLAGAISDVEIAMRLYQPKLMEQLALRGRPLQEMWLGYGAGLLAHIRRLTEPSWLVEEAEGILLHPVVGGAGQALPSMNRFLIEAVLTNPIPELPEVVRVAWLISQLQADLPLYSEQLEPQRAIPIAALASLVVTLAAAEVMELSRCEESTIQLAIEQWPVAIPALEDINVVLMPWWETYLQTRPTWSIALKALDKMLVGRLD